MGAAEHLTAVLAVASNLQSGGWALSRVGGHSGRRFGAISVGLCVGGGSHGNVVDDTELTALLGRPGGGSESRRVECMRGVMRGGRE